MADTSVAATVRSAVTQQMMVRVVTGSETNQVWIREREFALQDEWLRMAENGEEASLGTWRWREKRKEVGRRQGRVATWQFDIAR